MRSSSGHGFGPGGRCQHQGKARVASAATPAARHSPVIVLLKAVSSRSSPAFPGSTVESFDPPRRSGDGCEVWQIETVRATLCPVMRSGRLWLAFIGLVLGVAAMAIWLDHGGARGTPIRVAFAGPLSGLSVEDGLAGVRAIELIFDQVNAAGGIGGRPLVLDVYDDQNNPERARANAPEITDEPNTIAVIGHNYSTCSIAAGEIYAARGLPAISSAATNVAVTRDNPWYFRTIFNDRAQGRFIALYLKGGPGRRAHRGDPRERCLRCLSRERRSGGRTHARPRRRRPVGLRPGEPSARRSPRRHRPRGHGRRPPRTASCWPCNPERGWRSSDGCGIWDTRDASW